MNDTTFVDDECIMAMAPSPASLDKAMDAVLEITSRVFGISRREGTEGIGNEGRTGRDGGKGRRRGRARRINANVWGRKL